MQCQTPIKYQLFPNADDADYLCYVKRRQSPVPMAWHLLNNEIVSRIIRKKTFFRIQSCISHFPSSKCYYTVIPPQ